MARNFNYGDIARVAWGLKTDELTLFAGICESLSEGGYEDIRTILANLEAGTLGQTLPKDARELLIALAKDELRLR